MYSRIYNPKTKRYNNISTINGKKILATYVQTYLKQKGGCNIKGLSEDVDKIRALLDFATNISDNLINKNCIEDNQILKSEQSGELNNMVENTPGNYNVLETDRPKDESEKSAYESESEDEWEESVYESESEDEYDDLNELQDFIYPGKNNSRFIKYNPGDNRGKMPH